MIRRAGTGSRSQDASHPPAAAVRHITFVADGMGGSHRDRAEAAAAALDRSREIAAAAFELQPELAVVSFFSPELRDWLVNPGDGSGLQEVCRHGLSALAEAARSFGAAFRVLGRTDRIARALFPPATEGSEKLPRTLAWFLDYSGRDELTRAAMRFAREKPGQMLTDDAIAARLDTAGLPDPDLVIYAGGEFEPKDFLIWQGSYAELWHTPAPWRAFAAADLARALRDYAARQRRFGR